MFKKDQIEPRCCWHLQEVYKIVSDISGKKLNRKTNYFTQSLKLFVQFSVNCWRALVKTQ